MIRNFASKQDHQRCIGMGRRDTTFQRNQQLLQILRFIKGDTKVICVTKSQGGLHLWLSDKESTCQCRRCEFNLWIRKIHWRRKWQPTSAFLPGKSHRQRRLVGYSPWGRKKLDTVQRPHNNNIIKYTLGSFRN